jgi:hypothetical protein
MKNKYGVKKICLFCGSEFITKPRLLEYCSQPCKNPHNRPGNIPWNKGVKLNDDQKAKQNTLGLSKGHGWNRGILNERQREKWVINNPNKDGRLNNLRPKNYVDDDFNAYKRECQKATYRTVYAMKKEGIAKVTGKRKTDYQLDHIIPYKQGYTLGLYPTVIGGRNNLRYILGEENRSKWDCFQSDDVVKYITGEKHGL